MISQDVADGIFSSLEASSTRGAAFRRTAMEALDRLPGYDWSGIYRLVSDGLVLDEFVGAETEHTHISIGVGVCGTAVKEDRNVLVDDVRELSNYLACSLQTRSEIVVLIRNGDEILGQIDIDGHKVGAFDASDEALLQRIGSLIAERW